MAGLIPFNRRGLSVRNTDPFYNMLDDFFGDDWFGRRSLMSDTFKMDVRDDGGEYTIEAEVPGVKREEVNLTLNDGRLTLAVNRSEQVNDETGTYIHRERRMSSMQRSVYLADADDAGVRARLDEGVLRIQVPKRAGPAGAKQIEVE